jgi:bifunctional non-homologous end joining protein LigD
MAARSTTIEVDRRDITMSNPDKVLYPDDGYRKRDIVDYFRTVAEVMIPHLRDRPLVLRRFPDGIDTDGFYQKEASGHFPDWIRVASVPQVSSAKPVHHVVCADAATLVYLATQACLEFHVFLSTMDDLDRPVAAVFDLDPSGEIDLPDLRRITRGVCDRFRDAGLVPHVQATGGKGFHVVAPLAPTTHFDEVRAAMQEMANNAARDDPDWLTTEHRKQNRGSRVYLDVNRNAYGQTMIAPYSLRARPGAPAATPLELSELPRATTNGHGLADMHRRLAQKTDPWSTITEHAATLHPPG